LAPPAESGWTPPRYATPRRFTEQEITLECGPLTVPGTLAMPRGGRNRPGVVLISSGASDRDVTVGPNKPFKDLAWGLASRGVAVVRFDKVTHVHTHMEHEPGFTMVKEYLPNVLAAVRLLQQQPGVDPAQVFVAGHSGGGKAAVRVAAVDSSIAGVVMLAADTVPLPRAATRIFSYIADLEPVTNMAATLAGSAETIARTEDPTLSPETPSTELLFGWPASYWLDLREFDQVGTAATLDRPILALQGGRDYQVTEADDLAGWRAGLDGKPGVTIQVFAADDHMFFPGSGPSVPSDYQAPHHVDPAVVAAIAQWIAPGGGRSPMSRLLSRLGR
ncbi:alpha/beta hydrolase family protein, partial [Nocardia anaemiae]|uniref:alpha/beta hydrolase family protein n=1 Tax=Nocardia anaemiae TaxID=263910 RepID=UPI0007A49226